MIPEWYTHENLLALLMVAREGRSSKFKEILTNRPFGTRLPSDPDGVGSRIPLRPHRQHI